MASTRIIEQDQGTYTGLVTHHHNGYYAGDFRTPKQPTAIALPIIDRIFIAAADARASM
jgi:hypothetical protein